MPLAAERGKEDCVPLAEEISFIIYEEGKL